MNRSLQALESGVSIRPRTIASMEEAEIVTADGAVRIANACVHPDLFWGIKGGGGGSLGVVTRLTLRTRDLPDSFGGVFGTISATSDSTFRQPIARLIGFYHDQVFNRHWGEQIVFEPGNTIGIAMVFQGLDQRRADSVWRPFLDWVASSPQDFSIEKPVMIVGGPARRFWDAEFLRKNLPGIVAADDRLNSPAGNVFWAGDQGEVGQFLHGYRSAWLSASLLLRGTSREAPAASTQNEEDTMTAPKRNLRPVIARIWRGRTPVDKADEYARYLYEHGVKPLAEQALGVQMFREDRGSESEFVTISYWESVEAMARFAGKDPRRIHHLERDAEFLIELPSSVQILDILASIGQTGAEES